MDESKHRSINNNTNDNSNVPNKHTINDRSAIKMNDWKKQYKGNYMIFNSQNIDKPQVLELILIPSEDYCFVCNLTEGDPKEILKWGLKPKQLHKKVPYLKQCMPANRKGSAIIRVTYKGRIKNNKHKKEDTFIIEQKLSSEWHPIEYNLQGITKMRGVYQIRIPNHIRSRTVVGGTTIQTAMKLRDFYESECFANVPEMMSGRKKAPHGINRKITEYVESHNVIKKEEIQKLYNEEGSYFSGGKFTVPIEDWEEYQQFKRWKQFESQKS